MSRFEEKLNTFLKGPVMYVGPRPPHRRRITLRRTLGLALTGVVMVGVIGHNADHVRNVGAGAATAVERWVNHHKATVTAPAADDFAHLLDAERDWSTGHYPAAAEAWLMHNQGPSGQSDLAVAGWALRASILAHDQVLMDQAITNWNQVRTRLNDALGPAAPSVTLTPGQDGNAIWLALTGATGMPKAAWLDRAPLAEETQSDAHDCAGKTGCAPSPLWSPHQIQTAVSQAVATFKHQGFSAAQAWALYQERQMMGDAAHEINVPSRSPPGHLEALRLSLQQQLAQVTTPAQLDAYWATWAKLGEAGQLHADQDQTFAALGGLASSDVDWDQRLTGKGSGWSVPSSQDAYVWDRLASLMGRQLQSLPGGRDLDKDPVRAATVTAAVADQALRQALQVSGLRQLRWPQVFPNTPSVRWLLAQQLSGASAAIQQQTGWDGPVLGLAGHVSLDLAATAVGSLQGTQVMLPSERGKPRVQINSVISRDSIGALSHEWFHAQDYLTYASEHPESSNTSPLRYASQQAVLDMNAPLQATWIITRSAAAGQRATDQLWSQLRSPDLTDHQAQVGQLEAWVGNWSSLRPQWRQRFLEEAQTVLDHTWTARASATRWGHDAMPDEAHQQLLSLVQPPSQNWKPAVALDGQDAKTSSPWMKSVYGASRVGDAPAEYWSGAPEMLARSFERQATAQPAIFNRDVKSAWVYYPQGQEVALQQQVWQDYFKVQKGWWDQYRHALRANLGQALPVTKAAVSAVPSLSRTPR